MPPSDRLRETSVREPETGTPPAAAPSPRRIERAAAEPAGVRKTQECPARGPSPAPASPPVFSRRLPRDIPDLLGGDPPGLWLVQPLLGGRVLRLAMRDGRLRREGGLSAAAPRAIATALETLAAGMSGEMVLDLDCLGERAALLDVPVHPLLGPGAPFIGRARILRAFEERLPRASALGVSTPIPFDRARRRRFAAGVLLRHALDVRRETFHLPDLRSHPAPGPSPEAPPCPST